MKHILEQVSSFPEVQFEKGATILRQGEKKNQLLVMTAGSVEIIKNGTQICIVKDKGAVFGELSALLNNYHNATVRALEPCKFRRIEEANKFFANDPEATLYIAALLARRLSLLDSYFAEVKKEFFKLTTGMHRVAAKKKQQNEEMTEFWERAEKGLQERRHQMP